MLTLHPELAGNQVSVPRSEWERLMALARRVDTIRIDPPGPVGMGILRPEEHGLNFAAPPLREQMPDTPNFFARWAATAVRPARSNLWVWLFVAAICTTLAGMVSAVAWSESANPPPPQFRMTGPPPAGDPGNWN